MYSLIVTAKMNDVDPQAWLADVLAGSRAFGQRLDELLPWNWRRSARKVCRVTRRAGSNERCASRH